MAVKAIPDQYHSVQPYLLVEDAAGLIEFIRATFGAEEALRMPQPDGRIGHAEMRIGDSIVMLAEASTAEGSGVPMPATVMTYVETPMRRSNGHSRPERRRSASRPTSSTATGAPASWIRSATTGGSTLTSRMSRPRRPPDARRSSRARRRRSRMG